MWGDGRPGAEVLVARLGHLPEEAKGWARQRRQAEEDALAELDSAVGALEAALARRERLVEMEDRKVRHAEQRRLVAAGRLVELYGVAATSELTGLTPQDLRRAPTGRQT